MAPIHSGNATKKEMALYFNTLSCLVKNLEKQYILVDLRNELSLYGKVINVDAYMNMEMEDVTLYDTRGFGTNGCVHYKRVFELITVITMFLYAFTTALLLVLSHRAGEDVIKLLHYR